MTLTRKQHIFVEEYLRCWNGAEAARRAGYSAASARQRASHLLRQPAIRASIDERLADKAMGADEILLRLTEMARASLGDFLLIEEDGTSRVDLRIAAEKNLLHLIKKFKSTPLGVEIELHDAFAALSQLGKHHALLQEQPEPDWRAEFHAAGIDAQALFDRLVAEMVAALLTPLQDAQPKQLAG